jgi:tRNA(Ile)-lysidine synthase
MPRIDTFLTSSDNPGEGKDEIMPGSLIERVSAFCREHRLLEPGPVVVAVSGGADSLALLHILLALRAAFQIVPHVATFNHQIRATASAEDVRFVSDVAAAWGVPVTAGAADVPALAQEWGLGLEAAARKARYAFLVEVADQIGAHEIALGHNQDDQAETVLMHVLRGAGLAGLRGMLPRTPIAVMGADRAIVLSRPLLDISRMEIEGYVHGLNVEPRIDATNADTAYTRNWLRYEILPMLERRHPQVRRSLARTAELARDDYEALQSTLPSLDYQASGFRIERDRFLRLPVGQRRMWIRVALQGLVPAWELSYEQCAAALRLVEEHTHGARIWLAEDVWLRVANGIVIIFKEKDYPDSCPWMAPGESVLLGGAGTYPLPESPWLLKVERVQKSVESRGNPLSVVLAVPDRAEMALRTRRTGDRYKPYGLHGHSQKLSDTFVNDKVESHWRDRVPLLTVNGEIAWLVYPHLNTPHCHIAEPFAVRSDESRPMWRFSFVRSAEFA